MDNGSSGSCRDRLHTVRRGSREVLVDAFVVAPDRRRCNVVNYVSFRQAHNAGRSRGVEGYEG